MTAPFSTKCRIARGGSKEGAGGRTKMGNLKRFPASLVPFGISVMRYTAKGIIYTLVPACDELNSSPPPKKNPLASDASFR